MMKHRLIRDSLFFATIFGAFFSMKIAAQETVETTRAGYEKGFFVSHGDDYSLRLNGRLQTRAEYTYTLSKQHVAKLSVPYARLGLSGHVFDPRIGFTSQFAFDNPLNKGSAFRVIDFYANFGLVNEDLQLKVGHYAGGYTLLENYPLSKHALVARSFLFGEWNIGASNGLSLYRNKKNEWGFDLSVLENGYSPVSNKRRGVVSTNVSYNYGGLDATDQMDFEGGPFRILVSLGAFGRAQIDQWKLVGYAGALETIAKVANASINAGFLFGLPEAPKDGQSVGANIVQQELKDAKPNLAAYGQVGYVFDGFLGFAAQYATQGSLKKIGAQEILGGASFYLWEHNLKFQLDGGALINTSATPIVRGQFQLAF